MVGEGPLLFALKPKFLCIQKTPFNHASSICNLVFFLAVRPHHSEVYLLTWKHFFEVEILQVHFREGKSHYPLEWHLSPPWLGGSYEIATSGISFSLRLSKLYCRVISNCGRDCHKYYKYRRFSLVILNSLRKSLLVF